MIARRNISHPNIPIATSRKSRKGMPVKGLLGTTIGVLLLHILPLPAADGTISWDPNKRSLSANIRGVPINRLLESLSIETGWQIKIDPSLEASMTAQFEDLDAPDALRRLLGVFSFALQPRPGQSAELSVFRSSPHEATKIISTGRPTQGAPIDPTAAGRELLVHLKPGTGVSIEDLARRLGAKVTARIEEIDAYLLEFSSREAAEKARAQLERADDIASVEVNRVLTAPDWRNSLEADLTPSLPLKAKSTTTEGGQIVVALLDTAISPDSPLLKDFLLPAISVTDGPPTDSASLTHGTAMAETILRALARWSTDPEGTSVRILPIDVYGESPSASTFDVLNGLLVAAREGAQVVNLSLGGGDPMPLLDQAIQSLKNQGVLIVGAAGNDPSATRVYPAAYDGVLAVTAVDRNGNVAPYATRGDYVDLMAPGTSLVHLQDQLYLYTGTSPAAATISGTAAALLAQPGATPAAVVSLLHQQFGYQPQPPQTAD
jgi:hypothetical protein